MSCLDEDAILAWLAGDLADGARADVEQHVAACAECRRLVSLLAEEDHGSEGEGAPPPITSPPLGELGAVLDERFRLDQVIGRGGMGKVYRAFDLQEGVTVAVKRVELDDARFAREARLLAELAHPGIVGHVADGLTADGSRYLVMEWLDGETLAQRLARGPLSVEDTLVLGRRIAEALGAAHAGGVVHRDVTPGNIFLVAGQVEDAKLLDFGLARPPDDAAPRTRTGTFLGTPGYIAPEQARGERAVGPAADVFALGCVLYECLTGVRAFAGSNVLAVLARLLVDRPPRPRTLAPHVPRALDDLVVRMLARDPAKRPPDGSAALTELTVVGTFRTFFRRANLLRVGAVLGALGVLAAGGGAAALARRPGHAAAAAPVAPAKAPRTFVDVPLPDGVGAEAAAEYRAGLAAIRRASLEHARRHLEKALALAPTLAAAHLRLSIWTDTTMSASESRAHYRAAHADVTRLDARDRELLEAVVPAFFRDPPELEEAQRRLRELAARHPDDAELGLLGVGVSGSNATDAAYDAVLALDPGFAYAWWARANAQFNAIRYDDALASLDRCLAAAPDSAMCVLLRARIDARTGRCADVERDARLAIALEEGGSYGYAFLSNVLTARGADREAVLAAVHARALGISDPAGRARLETAERGAVAAAYGDFASAEAEARAYLALVKDAPFVQDHVPITLFLADVLEERGDLAGAGRVTDEFLRHRAAWRSVAIRPNDEPLPTFLAQAVRAGLRTAAEEQRERAAWIASWDARRTKLGPSAELEIWLDAWARPARDAARLEAAVGAMPAAAGAGPIAPTTQGWISPQGYASAYAGRVQARTAPALGIQSLATVAHHCNGLIEPITRRRASYWLGLAHEAAHDVPAACAAYEDLLAAWGNATPRSVTAEEARARRVALGCAGPR